MSVERDAKFAADVLKKAADLTARIGSIKESNGTAPDSAGVTVILETFFEVICQLQEYKQDEEDVGHESLYADKTILTAWYGLLEASRTLSGIPHNGAFLAARMTLFLMLAFGFQHTFPFDLEDSEMSRDRVKLYTKFSFALDELLLVQLRRIWVASRQPELFHWVTTHLESTDWKIRTKYNRAAMLAQSPDDLWRVPGMTSAQRWVPALDEEPIYESFSYATAASFGEPNTINEPQPVISQQLYSDGPIRFISQFCLIANNDLETWVRGPTLRRSRQFILDARQKAYPGLIKERELLALKGMTKSHIPFELQEIVLDLLDTPKWHPHLSRLDIGSAYIPFPKPEDECNTFTTCQGELDDSSKTLTCPARRFVLWNLGLRCFHTFHKTAHGWALCKHLGICEGHHDDDEWKIEHAKGLRAMVTRIVEDQCGVQPPVDSGWLAQITRINPHLGQLKASAKALKAQIDAMNGSFYGLDKEDHGADVRISGGTSGLLQCMLHEHVDIFGLGGELDRKVRIPSDWAWAESEDDLESAAMAVRALHR